MGGWVGGGEPVKKGGKKRGKILVGTQSASQATSHQSTVHTLGVFAVMSAVGWTKRGQVRAADKNLFSSAQKDSSFRSRKVEGK